MERFLKSDFSIGNGTMTRPKLIIFGDPQRRFAAEAVEHFVEFAKGRAEILGNCFGESCAVDILCDADFAIVFGGDGTILTAARYLCEADVPVIGVNVGRLGFLAEFSVDELISQFDEIVSGQMKIERRMILRCCVTRGGQEAFCATAVNEMVIAAGGPFNMIELKMSIEGQDLAGCFGDGLIVSTPTGSTAYNLSAGGPILAGDLSAVVITPLCPHSLSFRPIVIDAANVVKVEMLRVNEGTTLTLDGHNSHKMDRGDVVTVQKHHGSFMVVNNPVRTEWDTLASKLSWAEKPKYVERDEG